MNTAIIGYGKMGRLYDALLPASYIVEIDDLDRPYFPSVYDLIEARVAVDLVIIATPSELHFEHAYALLRAGYHVLVEKPICLHSRESRTLEHLARESERLLFQSCLERYNPSVKFISRHISAEEVESVESFRFGVRPERHNLDNPVYDLGIHDVDLWRHVFDRAVPWTIHVGYDDAPRREISLRLKNGDLVHADLLHHTVTARGRTVDLRRASQCNPILEMLNDIEYAGHLLNEPWHDSIEILERHSGPTIICDIREPLEAGAFLRIARASVA
jgi:predicted dehydrogenase